MHYYHSKELLNEKEINWIAGHWVIINPNNNPYNVIVCVRNHLCALIASITVDADSKQGDIKHNKIFMESVLRWESWYFYISSFYGKVDACGRICIWHPTPKYMPVKEDSSEVFFEVHVNVQKYTWLQKTNIHWT